MRVSRTRRASVDPQRPVEHADRRDRVAFGISLAVAAMIAFVAFSYNATSAEIRDVDRIGTEDVVLFSHAWEIRLLDSELTLAATSYITADEESRRTWLQAYDAAAFRLDEVLAATEAQATGEELAHLVQVDQANQELIRLEREIIELSDQDRETEALELLGGDYAEQKAIYRTGIDNYHAAQQDRIDRSVQTVASGARSTRVAILAILVVVVLVLTYLGRVNRIQRQEGRNREAERDAFAARQRRESRIQTALEMATAEPDALVTLERVLEQELPEWRSEVLLADSSTAHLLRAVTTHPDGEPACCVPTPGDCPAIRRGSTLVFDDTGSYDACPMLRSRDLTGRSVVCVPVKIMGRPIGIAHSTTPPQPSARHLERIEEIARLTGNRLGVLRAFATTRRQASRDPLTGAFNRRSMEDEASRLDLEGRPYSVAFCDIDHFKKLNDTYGHAVGDRALRRFSQVLSDSLRPMDHIARWGGEEFVVIMPDVEAGNACAAMDRVREALSLALIGGDHPRFTFSAGVAEANGEGFAETTARADAALLRAKGLGRDRVVTDELEGVTGTR